MRPRMSLIICALVLTVTACGKHGPVADQANNTGNLVAVVDQADATRAEAVKPPPPSATPPASTSPTDPPPTGDASNGPIPSALQGRWGLTPGDCTSRLGDAKGLLIVGANVLRFYESRSRALARPSDRQCFAWRQLRLHRRRPDVEQVRGIETERRQADTYRNQPSSELYLCEMLD